MMKMRVGLFVHSFFLLFLFSFSLSLFSLSFRKVGTNIVTKAIPLLLVSKYIQEHQRQKERDKRIKIKHRFKKFMNSRDIFNFREDEKEDDEESFLQKLKKQWKSSPYLRNALTYLLPAVVLVGAPRMVSKGKNVSAVNLSGTEKVNNNVLSRDIEQKKDFEGTFPELLNFILTNKDNYLLFSLLKGYPSEYIQNVPGDGNCFFRSLLGSLDQDFHDVEKALLLRKEVVEEVIRTIEKVQKCIIEKGKSYLRQHHIETNSDFSFIGRIIELLLEENFWTGSGTLFSKTKREGIFIKALQEKYPAIELLQDEAFVHKVFTTYYSYATTSRFLIDDSARNRLMRFMKDAYSSDKAEQIEEAVEAVLDFYYSNTNDSSYYEKDKLKISHKIDELYSLLFEETFPPHLVNVTEASDEDLREEKVLFENTRKDKKHILKKIGEYFPVELRMISKKEICKNFIFALLQAYNTAPYGELYEQIAVGDSLERYLKDAYSPSTRKQEIFIERAKKAITSHKKSLHQEFNLNTLNGKLDLYRATMGGLLIPRGSTLPDVPYADEHEIKGALLLFQKQGRGRNIHIIDDYRNAVVSYTDSRNSEYPLILIRTGNNHYMYVYPAKIQEILNNIRAQSINANELITKDGNASNNQHDTTVIS